MIPPRIHYIQHVPFEGLGSIQNWAETNKARVSSTKLFQNEQFPLQEDFDWLIVMGGPMNIYQDELYPWLAAEKNFIKESIANNKVVLGICLGAQLIADVLGQKIYSNAEKEIGWFPVCFFRENLPEQLKTILPGELTVMHWHGDTFNLPEGAVHLAKSTACQNQGFIYNERVAALQFHLETTPESLQALIENCADEIREGNYIQTAQTMLNSDNFTAINKTMGNLLDYFSTKFPIKK